MRHAKATLYILAYVLAHHIRYVSLDHPDVESQDIRGKFSWAARGRFSLRRRSKLAITFDEDTGTSLDVSAV